MKEERAAFKQWAVIEIFGHQQIAGLVTEEPIAGQNMLRVDVPELGPERPAYTRYYGGGAIYSISPCSEALARQAAESLRRWDNPLPVAVPDLTHANETIRTAERLREHMARQPAAIGAGSSSDFDVVDDDDDDDEFDDPEF